ncbi:MAG: PP0621 family protein, partial [Aquincola tertiaricarbonis]
MKYVVLLLIVALVLYVMSRKRAAPPPPPPAKPPPAPRIEGIVACERCGLHLPRSEALPGPGGELFCSPAHRDAGP